MRILWKLLLVIVLGAVAVGIYIMYNITGMVEDRMTETMQTPVKISRVEIWWGSVAVRDLRIQNIPGSKLQPALHVPTIDIKADPKTIMQEGAHVAEIIVKGPELTVELYDQRGNDTNWSRMLAHMKGGEGQKTKQEFKLDHLLVTDIVVRATGGPIKGEPLEVKIPRIEEFNVTSDSPVPMRAIIEAVSHAVIQRTLEQALPDLLKNPGEAVKGVMEKGVPGGLQNMPSLPSVPGFSPSKGK